MNFTRPQDALEHAPVGLRHPPAVLIRSAELSSDTPGEARGATDGRRAGGRRHAAPVHDGLTRLNTLSLAAAEAALRPCCGSRRWARRMAAHRPYPDLESLLAAADEAVYDLTPADLGEALAEESGTPIPHHGGPAARTALRAAHSAYAARFGHVFVIAVDGRAPDEFLDRTLDQIRTRLWNDADEERVVTIEELRRITRSRLVRLVSEGPGRSRRRPDGKPHGRLSSPLPG